MTKFDKLKEDVNFCKEHSKSADLKVLMDMIKYKDSLIEIFIKELSMNKFTYEEAVHSASIINQLFN